MSIPNYLWAPDRRRSRENGLSRSERATRLVNKALALVQRLIGHTLLLLLLLLPPRAATTTAEAAMRRARAVVGLVRIRMRGHVVQAAHAAAAVRRRCRRSRLALHLDPGLERAPLGRAVSGSDDGAEVEPVAGVQDGRQVRECLELAALYVEEDLSWMKNWLLIIIRSLINYFLVELFFTLISYFLV